MKTHKEMIESAEKRLRFLRIEQDALKFIEHEQIDPVHYIIIKLLITIIDLLISDT